MYKAKGTGMVWDNEKNVPLCEFKGGVFETEDKKVADKLERMGYEVTGESIAKKKPAAKGE